jgi:hypothetical protein
MMPAEDLEPFVDPDETQPPTPRVYTPPPRRMQPGAGWKVDRAAPELARLCAGWAQRGRSLADLVGVVRRNCGCNPTVMPRVEIAARVAPGRLLDALRAIRIEPDRLAVVEVSSDPRGPGDPEFREHQIRVPSVDADDTRGLLEPLSAKRRELLDRRMGDRRRPLSWPFIRDLLDHHTPDALYLEAKLLHLGGALQVCHREFASPEERRLLDAASYEVHPGKLACLVYPDWTWERESAAWIDLEQLGLRPNEDPCHPTTQFRLHDVHREGLRMGIYG